jgi:hypothetical protein
MFRRQKTRRTALAKDRIVPCGFIFGHGGRPRRAPQPRVPNTDRAAMIA